MIKRCERDVKFDVKKSSKSIWRMQFIKSVKIDPKILESKIKRTNFRK